MKISMTMAVAALAVTGLAGCVETATQLPGNSAEGAARDACVRDTRLTTNNPDVVVQSSSFSEAGTEVIMIVGGTGTWRCIAYRDGSTAGIMSLTNEGFL
jgi:predicted polyphosphate/ATP-dependent NAD kinase